MTSTGLLAAKDRLGKKPMDPLLNGAGDLVTKGMEKAEVLDAFWALAFTGKPSGIAGTRDLWESTEKLRHPK